MENPTQADVREYLADILSASSVREVLVAVSEINLVKGETLRQAAETRAQGWSLVRDAKVLQGIIAKRYPV